MHDSNAHPAYAHYIQKLQERARVLKACDSSTKGHEKARQLVIERCREDVEFFIEMFGFTFDPRNDKMQDLPFFLYPFQADMLHWFDSLLTNKEDGIVEKSRDMGVTWIALVWMIHKWMFRPGTQILIGSRKEDLVDNWTRDSHFGKLAYFLSNLPYWLLPQGFNMPEHRMKLKLINPANGNVIIGESANADFSRQGRYTCVFFDEAAFWPDLEASFRAAAGATNTRILVSTPNGYNTFARIRDSGLYKILTILWRLHPERKPDAHGYSQWYEDQKARMSAEDLAQEVDISYHRSARGVVYPGFQNVPFGDYPYIRGYSVFTSWDFGIADNTAIIWFARHPVTGKIRIIDCYTNAGKPIDFYIPFVLGSIPDGVNYDYSYDELVKISEHAALPKPINFGDPDVAKRSLGSGLSVLDILTSFNLPIFTNTQVRDFRTRKNMTEQGIKLIEGINYPRCAEVREAILNARFPTRSADSQSTVEIIKPIHDWTEAYRSALEYFFVNQPPIQMIDRPAPSKRVMAYDRS